MSATAPIPLEHWIPDPERPGYLAFAGTPTYREVFTALAGALAAEGLVDEYFAPGLAIDGPALDALVPRGARRVACWAATGGSEGHYVHVELVYPGRRVRLALGKTFLGWDHAWAIAKRAAELLGA